MNRMRLRTLLLQPAALMLAMLASCSPLIEEALPGGKTPAVLGVGDVFIAGAGSTTRANTTLSTGKLWVSIRNTGSYAARQGLVYEYTGGAWTCPTSVILGNDPISLYAYYPQDKFNVTGGKVSFSARGYSAEYDLCFATGSKSDVNDINPQATFELKHAYARVRLSITREAAFTGTGAITAYNLKAATDNINLDGTLDVEGGTSTSTNASSTGYTASLSTTVTAGVANTACDMLVPPQLIPTAGLTITLTIDGNERSVTITQGQFGAALLSNTQYTVHLEIGANATLVPGTIEEVGWPALTDLGEIEHVVNP